MILKYFYLIPLLFLFLSTTGQIKGLDTTAHKRYPIDIKYVTYGNNEHLINIDTTLNNLFLFRPLEHCFTCFDLGNIGQPGFNGNFLPDMSTEIRPGISIYDNNLYHLDELQFFRVRRPYTELYYTLGSKNEQVFHASLAERLRNNFFAGFNMRYASSTGFYNRQKTPFSNFSGYVQYTGKKLHFTTRTGFIVNRVRAAINGGVVNDSFINDPLITQKILEPVRLDTAVNSIKQTGFVWQSSYDFGNLTIDTSKKITQYTLDKKVRFENTFSYEKTKYLISDDSSDVSNYYVSFPRYTIQDSITVHRFKDAIGIKLFSQKLPGYNTHISAGINYLRIFQPLLNNSYTQYFFKASDKRYFINIKKDSAKAYNGSYFINAESAYSKAFNSTYSLSGEVHFSTVGTLLNNNHPPANINGISKNDQISTYELSDIVVNIKQSSSAPTLFQNSYNTNLFQWQNNFKNVRTFQSSISYIIKHFELHLIHTTLANYIYYGLDATPQQYSGIINISQIQLATRFKLWRHFYTSNELLYQKINNTSIVSLPTVILRSQLYFERDAFKKASHVQLGIMIRYWSDYYAPNYMPATMQFYLQQEKVYKVIPIGDVFASMQIKTAQLFLRFSNMGSYFIKSINYTALHYPMQDATINFGVKWIMWN